MPRTVLLDLGPAPTAGDLEAGIRRAIASGFDGVELVLPTPLDTRMANAARRFETGRVGSVAWRCTSPSESAAVAEAEAMLACAERLQAKVLNVTIPPLNVRGRGGGFSSYQNALDFAYGLLHEVRLAAEVRGVAVAAESAVEGCLLSPVELREIIDAANSWAVGACVDVHRIARVGCPVDWLTTLGPRVHSVRIGYDVQAAFPPHGTSSAAVDWPRVAETLDRIGYEGVVVIAGDGDPSVWRSRGPVLAGAGGLPLYVDQQPPSSAAPQPPPSTRGD